MRNGLTLESPLTPTARAREKRSPLTPHYWCRVAALLSQTSRDHSCGRVTPQVHTRGTPLDHSCGRVAQRALERRRVQQRCPRGFSSAALGRRPQNRAKGADPRTGTPKKGETFSVLVSWPACPGAFLVSGPWFSGPAPSGSGLFWFRLVFLSTGRGRHVPAPSGRDVGSSSGAPTQGPAFLQVSLYVRLCCVPPRACVPRRACLALPLPLCFFLCYFFDGRVTHSAHLRSLHSVSLHPSFGWP